MHRRAASADGRRNARSKEIGAPRQHDIEMRKIAKNIANLCWKFGSLLYFLGTTCETPRGARWLADGRLLLERADVASGAAGW